MPTGMDHLHNHRLPIHGDGTSPDGHPRAVVTPDGNEEAVAPHDARAQSTAITVGGGTRFFGAQAWRFHPDDFQMASIYGVPEGSALADWPIAYEDLEPYYDMVEWELGVAGEASGVHPPPTRLPNGSLAALAWKESAWPLRPSNSAGLQPGCRC